MELVRPPPNSAPYRTFREYLVEVQERGSPSGQQAIYGQPSQELSAVTLLPTIYMISVMQFGSGADLVTGCPAIVSGWETGQLP
ncbi:hypothetical protein HTV45_03600 [Streptomyces sp. CHD11]|uniref:hypothetical protein n=1 Tax=Streptomyces sp. CHD11 TaxID=2741325 RepID=UPI001BFC27C3|nr:hypothetical protein [Streptomyces sp. CHD11]MBT3150000.1 hypothetical protein [Streptomyces sp. CHD11]